MDRNNLSTEQLKGLVQHIAFNRFIPAENSEFIPVVPDGMTELVIQLGDKYVRKTIDNNQEIEIKSSHLICLKTKPVLVQPKANMRTVNIRFKPAALGFFIKADFKALCNQVLDAELFFGKDIHVLEDQLYNSKTDAESVQFIETFLKGKLEVNSKKQELQNILKDMFQKPNQKELKKIIDTRGYKYTERLFKTYMGVSPVTMGQLLMFNFASKLISTRKTDSLTSIGLDSGYFDQAHFINKFKKFSGFSPKEYKRMEYQMLKSNQESINSLLGN